ncbi:hypothetical protein BN14_08832 [Rhizoctonia solani AG-1 IB]|nr:hypothetical protein BN14_08832 [Rhizoctonia solani AG-1 IB]
MPTDTSPNAQKDIEHTPTISYSITISDDPKSSSNLQKEALTTSRLSPSIHELAWVLESQNPPNWQYRSPKTLSPSLSICTLSLLSQSPSPFPEPNPSKLPEPLPFQDKLNTFALDRGPDPPLSPMLHGPGVNSAPIPQTSTPSSVHKPQAHQALASLQANSPDPLVEVRLKELRKTLTSLKKQLKA